MNDVPWIAVKKLGFLLFFFLLKGSLTQASSFDPEPFPQTVEKAPVIVRGIIGTQYSDWGTDSDGTKRLYTYSRLQVTSILKGNLNSSSLLFRELGGEKDGTVNQVSGAAQFEQGEDVVVFLSNQNSEESFDLLGLMMGKYGIETGSDGVEYLTGQGLIESDSTSSQKWSLSALRELIENKTVPTKATPPTPQPEANLNLTKNIDLKSLSPALSQITNLSEKNSTDSELSHESKLRQNIQGFFEFLLVFLLGFMLGWAWDRLKN